MENQASPVAARLRSLLGFLLILAVPFGLAVMYPHDAKEAYERAGQLLRGEYGPVDLIPADGKEVMVEVNELGVTDVPLPSVKEAVAAEEARAARALHEAAVRETMANRASAPGAASPPSAPAMSVSATDVPAPAATPAAPQAAPAAVASPAADAKAPAAPAAAPAKSGTPVSAAPQSPAAPADQQAAEVTPASVRAAVSGALNNTPAAKTPAFVYEAPAAPMVGPKTALPVVKMDLTAAAGVWSGDFIGPASGKISLVASQDGILRGRLTPDATRRAVIVEGRVISEAGDVEFSQRVSGRTSPWNFIGRLSPAGGSGQWTSADPVQPPGTWNLQRGNPELDAARAVMQERLNAGGMPGR